MNSVVFKPLKTMFLWSLILILAACSTKATPTSLNETDSPYYIAFVEISDVTTEAQLEAEYNAEIVSFVPEAGFAVLGFSKVAGELTTLSTTINQDTFQSPEMTMGGHSAWAGGFSAWAGGWSAWASGDSNSGMKANASAWDQINLQEAHAISRKFGEGIKVAVIDTGIDRYHPMFQGRLSHSSDWWDFVDNNWDPQEAGSGNGRGHGTAVASIILQIAPKAKIMPIRVLDADGKGDTDDVIKAIKRAVDKGADIINVSLGSVQDDYALYQMAAYANSQNVMIVASAGNYGNSTITHPARYTYHGGETFYKTIAIGSVDSFNKRSSFSSYGAALYGVAPGEGIKAAYPGGQTVSVKGTSFASPMYTGAIALALSEGLNRDGLKYLWHSSTDIKSTNPELDYGGWLLNVEGLVRRADNFREPEYQLKAVHSGQCLDAGGTFNGSSVVQANCHLGGTQKWKLYPVGDSYKFINAASGKLLDVSGVSYSNGANVHLWSDWGGANQRWKLQAKATDTFEFRAEHSNMCLDVSGNSNVHQWSCHGGGNQQFQLVLVN